MPQQMKRRGDVRVIPDVLVEQYKARGWEPAGSAPADGEALKGAELNQALEDAGLPKTGSADDKRARLAEHAAQQNPNTPEEQA